MSISQSELRVFACGCLTSAVLIGGVMYGVTQKTGAAPQPCNESYLQQTDEVSQTQPIPNIGVNDPSYRLLHDWPSLLEQDLNEQEARLVEDVPIDGIVIKFSSDLEFQRAVMDKVKADEDTFTRWFFVRVLSNTDYNLRQKVADELLNAPRMLDKDAGLSVIMSIYDLELKSQILGKLLTSNITADTLRLALRYIRIDNDLIESGLLNPALQGVYQNTDNQMIKALALKVMMPGQSLEPALFENVLTLIASTDEQVCNMGLDALNEWAVNYYGLLSPEQTSHLQQVLNNISVDLERDLQTRIKALEVHINL
jgi:hypothetical protein